MPWSDVSVGAKKLRVGKGKKKRIVSRKNIYTLVKRNNNLWIGTKNNKNCELIERSRVKK